MNESSAPRWHDLHRRLAETFGTSANSGPPIGAKSRNSRGAATSGQSWLVRARSGATHHSTKGAIP